MDLSGSSKTMVAFGESPWRTSARGFDVHSGFTSLPPRPVTTYWDESSVMPALSRAVNCTSTRTRWVPADAPSSRACTCSGGSQPSFSSGTTAVHPRHSARDSGARAQRHAWLRLRTQEHIAEEQCQGSDEGQRYQHHAPAPAFGRHCGGRLFGGNRGHAPSLRCPAWKTPAAVRAAPRHSLRAGSCSGPVGRGGHWMCSRTSVRFTGSATKRSSSMYSSTARIRIQWPGCCAPPSRASLATQTPVPASTGILVRPGPHNGRAGSSGR